jgi:hypothetical protein
LQAFSFNYFCPVFNILQSAKSCFSGQSGQRVSRLFSVRKLYIFNDYRQSNQLLGSAFGEEKAEGEASRSEAAPPLSERSLGDVKPRLLQHTMHG